MGGLCSKCTKTKSKDGKNNEESKLYLNLSEKC